MSHYAGIQSEDEKREPPNSISYLRFACSMVGKSYTKWWCIIMVASVHIDVGYPESPSKAMLRMWKPRLVEMTLAHIDVSENRCTTKSSILIGCSWVFPYKPSILGYPYFWKHPSRRNVISLFSSSSNSCNWIRCLLKKVFWLWITLFWRTLCCRKKTP